MSNDSKSISGSRNINLSWRKMSIAQGHFLLSMPASTRALT